MKKFNLLFKIFFLLCFIFLIFYCILIYNIIKFSKKQYNGRADAVIVMGAAEWNGKPSPILKERINHALKILEEQRARYVVFTGGYGKNSPFAESLVSKNYSVRKGISADSIIVENVSNSSIDNLYYAFKVAGHFQLKTFIIVSDPIHMLRTMCIADYYGRQCWSSPTPTSKFVSKKEKLKFAFYEAWNMIKLYCKFLFNPGSDGETL